MKEMTEAEALRRAASYCSASERSAHEVRLKVEGFGLDADAVDRIVERLVEERFVDDARFCRAFVRDRLRFNKWGKQRLSLELYKKGIDAALRNEVLSEIGDEEYREILCAVLEAKKRSLREDDSRAAYAKLFRFAMGRGFENRWIVSCLKQVCDDEASDEFFE